MSPLWACCGSSRRWPSSTSKPCRAFDPMSLGVPTLWRVSAACWGETLPPSVAKDAQNDDLDASSGASEPGAADPWEPPQASSPPASSTSTASAGVLGFCMRLLNRRRRHAALCPLDVWYVDRRPYVRSPRQESPA